MKAKDKAKELFDKYYSKPIRYWSSVRNFKIFSMGKGEARECAIIAVDEILKCNPCNIANGGLVSTKEYWQEVKKEIENL